jgi:chemotaxis response regulator CheB
MNSRPIAAPLRVLIVDDSGHYLDAARRVLEQDGVDVVGTASTSAHALRLAAELRPDGTLIDVDLGDEDGIELSLEFEARKLGPVVLISAYPESEIGDFIAGSSAAGFVPKSELSAGTISRLFRTEPDPG